MRPPAIPLADTLILVLAAQALVIALAALVVVRKLRRDRRERVSRRRRAEFAAAICDGSAADLRRLGRACAHEPTALLDLLYVLKNGEPVPAVRRAALLEAARQSGLLRKLRLALEAGKPTTRGVAALALSALRLPGGEARVARLTADSDADVRLAAGHALANWSTPASARALISSLDRFDLPSERVVEKLGGAWAAPVVHDALRQALGEDSAEPVSPQRIRNRVQLVRALELSAYEAAEPELLRLLETGDAEEQISAARALGRAGSPRAIPALIAALEAESWPLRAQAARALGQLVAVEALPQLAAHLSDRAWWVRKQAGRALVALGSAGGYELLEQALTHEDRYARDRALEELRLAYVARHRGAPDRGLAAQAGLGGPAPSRNQAA